MVTASRNSEKVASIDLRNRTVSSEWRSLRSKPNEFVKPYMQHAESIENSNYFLRFLSQCYYRPRALHHMSQKYLQGYSLPVGITRRIAEEHVHSNFTMQDSQKEKK